MDGNNTSDFAHRPDAHMAQLNFTPNEVTAALCVSKNAISCGPVGRPSKFLRLIPELRVLLSIFKLSITQ